jgi:membrane-associated phospholipid phosphatase
MNSRKIIGWLLPALGATCLVVRADMVTDWNWAALNAIKTERTTPPEASRALAILHVSIFDACNGISQNNQPYYVTNKPAGVASKEAAIAAAAHTVLVRLFPAQQDAFDMAYAESLGGVTDGPAASVGISWGEFVANAILQLRSEDGSDIAVEYTPGSGPGIWVPTPPALAPALLPNWPQVTPFAMINGSQFRPPPPPGLDSAQWAFDFNLTKELGRSDSATRTAEQSEIARFWADGPGTVTPPGHWNIIARDLALQRGNTLDQNARLFALLNIAEADAAIIAWDCKYAFNFWRPITAIPNADIDGNPDTVSDPTWTPFLVTPNFPEYISGHSTFSGAAAAVLGVVFGSDDISFTTTSEDMPGTPRTFSSFSQAAQEAGMSRIYGGIHFLSANVNGLSSGGALGLYVAQNLLPAMPGKSQRGH